MFLGPPSGVMRIILWPATLLLWATGPGAPLPNGRYEWTPVQDFVISLGTGVAVAFWIVIAGRVVSHVTPKLQGLKVGLYVSRRRVG